MAVDVFHDRWASSAQVGDARPTATVLIRLGRFRRGYKRWTGDPVDADIYGETKGKPWMATWEPTTQWFELPNAESVDLTQDYDDNGLIVASIVLTNVGLVQRPAVGGDIFHLIERGHLSPWRGHGATNPPPPEAPNQWAGMLDRKAQIKVLQGYGDAQEPAYTGLLDDCDLTAAPDRITITGRDFGQVLVDEHVFGWVKSKQLPEPTIFEAKGNLRGTGTAVGTDPRASSTRDRHPARFVVDKNTESAWISHDHTTPDNTEWVEIRLPRGRYESIAIHNAYPGMEVYAGIYARNLNGKPPRINGRNIGEGWIFASELGDPDMGGMVPGDRGGWPYIRKWGSMSDKGHTNLLGNAFELGDDSVLRVGFRKLAKVTPGVYRAGVVRLAAVKRTITEEERKAHRKIIEVGDVSEIVKVVLRWAGFKEWIVEDTGVQMQRGQNIALKFNRADTLIDVINKVKEATGFVFYMLPPTDDDLSIGVPVFESNLSIADLPGLELLRDDDLLTGVQSKATDEPLATDIRVRGKESKQYGKTLGNGQSSKRVMAHYKPPWGIRTYRMSGLIKHVIHTYEKVRHTDECMVLAQLIALAEALASTAAEVEVPGTVRHGLNRQVFVSDTGTGIHSRLYIARRSSTFRLTSDGQGGSEAIYATTLGGALLDLPDVQGVVEDLRRTLRKMGKDPNRLTMGDALLVEGT